MDKYPNSKDKFQNKSGSQPDALTIAVNEFLQEFIVVSSIGTWVFLKSLISRWFPFSWGSLIALLYYSFYLAANGIHIVWIHELEPNLITMERLGWMYEIAILYHWIVLFLMFFSPLVLVLGGWARATRTKYQKLFEMIGIQNGRKDTPKLIRIERHDKHRKSYIFDANGVSLENFNDKKSHLESFFRTNVESIKHGRHQGQIVVTFSTMKFPEKVKYTDLVASHVLPKEGFFLGMSGEGVVTQRIDELPHMIIAGTTGSGKSVQFKQIIMGLLESSPHLQMYLIDLKGGVEMIDFVKCPNVKVVKTMDDALVVLRRVEKEMKDRFRYLEAKSRKQIIPEKDHKDRIVVGVDECSVLYMNRPRNDPEYQSALEARQLADSISKLSRAASIHLILATQKLDRQVIPTSVSENISGRMAFRANSLQGSLIVLGTKDACDLPDIPGRGVWNCGTKKVIVQAPFIDEKTIKARCLGIVDQFAKEKKKLFSPMLGEAEKSKVAKQHKRAYGAVKENT
ncbi:MAG: FtsK/SpoIIIE domain-containing protein [Oligoflexales bacterium]